jgi:shikimate dehydrogenase
MQITGKTRVFAILGDPVAHSLSPAMQNAAFHALGVEAVYVPLRCDAAALGPLMETLAAQGGGGNVTIPHKSAAAEVIARHAPSGPPLQVCNTFWGCEGRLAGAETDSGAIVTVLERLGAPGNNWLVIGTGGSAHAALLAAARSGARLAVRSRSPVRARAFEQLVESLGVPRASDSRYDVVLNCTPLGWQESDPLPLDPQRIPERAVALDLVYRPGETRWVRALRALGRTAVDGREVLLEQGAAAFELWFPDRRAPREVMRAAVRFALE